MYLYSCVKCHLRNNTSNTNTVIQEDQAEMKVQTEEIERKQDEMKVKHELFVDIYFGVKYYKMSIYRPCQFRKMMTKSNKLKLR